MKDYKTGEISPTKKLEGYRKTGHSPKHPPNHPEKETEKQSIGRYDQMLIEAIVEPKFW